MARFALTVTTLAAVGLTALSVAACGGFSERNVCLINADPSCRPDLQDPTIPDRIGPNPNFPDPNVWKGVDAPLELDQAPSKSPIRINELLLDPDGENAGTQKIEFLNDTGVDFDATGCIVRLDHGDWAFPAGTVILAGATVVIHVGIAGEDSATELHAPELSEIDAHNGGLSLITADGMVSDYVQWGKRPSDQESGAVVERQWVAGRTCVKPVEGTSLAFVGSGNLPTDFTARYATIGQPNG